MNHVIGVTFDPAKNGFTFSGLTYTPAGLRLNVPYDPNIPTEIRIQKQDPLATWKFKMISFRGPTGSQLILADAWATVTQDEIFPYMVADVVPVKLEVQSFNDAEIVILDTNRATQIDIGISLQLTIFDTKEGSWWTSPDPQIVNDKEPG